jgi:hypothetical protein
MAAFSGGGSNFPPLLNNNNNQQDGGYWVSLETVNFNLTATQLPIFAVHKFLEQTFQGTSTARPTREGKLLIRANSKKIANSAVKRKRFYDICDINIQMVDSMNWKTGSIYGREILSCSVEEMETNMKNQGVVKIERALSMKDGVLSPNGLHILTFDAVRLPEEVYVGYMRYSVRTYYPRPLRCSKCCVFGHSRKRCTVEEEACRHCDKPIHQGTLCAGKFCRNCKKDTHGSFDRNCPTFEVEVAIVRLKIDNNISYGQARAIMSKDMDKCANSYVNKVLSQYQLASKNRAMESEDVKKAIEQNLKEIDELKEEIAKLQETTRTLEDLKAQKKAIIEHNNSLMNANQAPTTTQYTVPFPITPTPKSTKVTSKAPTGMPMETSTNLKRKNTETPEGSKADRTRIITMTNSTNLNKDQQAEIIRVARSCEDITEICFFIDDKQQIQVRNAKNKMEGDQTKKMIQYIRYQELEASSDENEVSIVDNAL